jgi:hypothetical protein
VGTNAGGETQRLELLEQVRCLDCGAAYTKPAGGGTVRENPGCPDCGYVGWIDALTVVRERSQPHRFDAGHPPPPNGRSR